MFGRIEFRTVRRLFDKGDVVGDLQRSRTMTRCAVQHHRNVFVQMSSGYFGEKDRQRGRVHVGENEGVEFPVLWAHGSEGVRVLSNDLAAGLWTHSRLAPRPSGVRNAPEPSFILKHKPKTAPMQHRLDPPFDDDSGEKRLGILCGQ